MWAAIGIAVLVALLPGFQTSGVSQRQRRRLLPFGGLAPDVPSERGPIDSGRRFALVARRATRMTAASCAVAVALAVTLWVVGAEPLAALAALVALVEAAVVAGDLRRNRLAWLHAQEELHTPPPEGWR
ncbi:MAG: hypothetical protein ACRD0G_13305 [Acidimicrobiales bacterium]